MPQILHKCHLKVMVYHRGFNTNKEKRERKKFKVFPSLSNLKPVVLPLSLQLNSDTNH